MSTLWAMVLSNALVATALAVVAAVAGRLCRRPALAHGLWLLVLLKLLTPPLVSLEVPWPAGIGHLGTRNVADVVETGKPAREPSPAPAREALDGFTHEVELTSINAELAEADLDTEAPDVAQTSRTAALPAADSFLLATAQPALPEATAAPRVSFLAEVVTPLWRLAADARTWLALWLAGALAWLALALYRVRRFLRVLQFAEPAEAELEEEVRALGERMGLSRPPGVWHVPGEVCPMIWAIGGRPKLLLPEGLWERLGTEERSALLVHELAHLRRRDHWVRAVEALATCLYWWHPVAWWARRGLREAEEQCCDAWVVSTLPGQARAYATALLEAVDFVSRTRPALPLASSGMAQFRDLKRRLIMIKQAKTPRSLSWAGAVVVWGMAAILLPLAPAWAQKNDSGGDDKAKAEQRAQEQEAEAKARTQIEREQRAAERAKQESLRAQGKFDAARARAKEDSARREAQIQEEKAEALQEQADAAKAAAERAEARVKEAMGLVQDRIQRALKEGRGVDEQDARQLQRLAREAAEAAIESMSNVDNEHLREALRQARQELSDVLREGGPVDREVRDSLKQLNERIAELKDSGVGEVYDKLQQALQDERDRREEAEDLDADKGAAGAETPEARAEREQFQKELEKARAEVRDLREHLLAAERRLRDIERKRPRPQLFSANEKQKARRAAEVRAKALLKDDATRQKSETKATVKKDSTEKRMDVLEKKLDTLLDELKSIKTQRSDSGRGPERAR